MNTYERHGESKDSLNLLDPDHLLGRLPFHSSIPAMLL
jgi:hypothetical protein